MEQVYISCCCVLGSVNIWVIFGSLKNRTNLRDWQYKKGFTSSVIKTKWNYKVHLYSKRTFSTNLKFIMGNCCFPKTDYVHSSYSSLSHKVHSSSDNELHIHNNVQEHHSSSSSSSSSSDSEKEVAKQLHIHLNLQEDHSSSSSSSSSSDSE